MPTVEKVLPMARKRLATIQIDARLVDAARQLNGPQRNLVVVCDEAGKMAGIITKTDVVSRISTCTGFSCTMPAADAMTQDVTFCRADDRLHDVWARIREQGLKSIPVVDREQRPIGVLIARDALRVLLEDAEYEEHLLRDYVMTVGYH